jgi:CMP-N-acetylneuraminic acid synthetase
LLDGEPLLDCGIKVALESEPFEAVVVSTEDAEIAVIAESSGAMVRECSSVLVTNVVRLPDVCIDVIETYRKKRRL